MGKIVVHNKRLLFQTEVLRARLGIRDFFLKTAVRDVYENIGQVLSLVRMQLNFLNPDPKQVSMDDINGAGNLVGQSLRDLRHLCKSFYPDHDILKEGGFIEALESILLLMDHKSHCQVQEIGTRAEMPPGLSLIVFKILQEILISIKHIKGRCKGITVTYKKDRLIFDIYYHGEPIDWKKQFIDNGEDMHLSIPERTNLINGSLHNHKQHDGVVHVELTAPLNDHSNE